tara:strand:- start:32 stop:625 length:594 start_codon:yes stop_codon:yes gene_type:complete
MSILEVNTINPQSGNDVTIGGSSKNVKFASGTTVDFSTNTPTLTLGVAMKNTPAFEARLSSDQTISDDTLTKISVNEEVFDTDNCYDNSSNYRFTPTVAGKYFVYWVVCGQANSANAYNSNGFIYFNGSQYNGANIVPNGNSSGGSTTAIAIIDFNGSSDYVEFYLKVDAISGTVKADHDFSGGNTTYAGAYRLIGA